jgi:hypothetical protein
MQLLQPWRSNWRLRVGLAAIVALLGASALLDWRDSLQARTNEYRKLATQLARLKSQVADDRWASRAADAQVLRDEARARLWSSRSTGLAQAAAQDWLNTLLRQAAVTAPSVKVGEGDVALDASGVAPRLPETLKGLVPIRARVQFGSDTSAWMAVLTAVHDHPRLIVVDSLSWKGNRAELNLSFWFLLDPEAASAGAGLGGTPAARPPSARAGQT